MNQKDRNSSVVLVCCHSLSVMFTLPCFGCCYSAGEEIKKLQETYNKTQQNWMDNMINACQVRGWN